MIMRMMMALRQACYCTENDTSTFTHVGLHSQQEKRIKIDYALDDIFFKTQEKKAGVETERNIAG